MTYLFSIVLSYIYSRQVLPHVNAPLLFNSNSLKLFLYIVLLFICLSFYQINFVLFPLDVLEVFELLYL